MKRFIHNKHLLQKADTIIKDIQQMDILGESFEKDAAIVQKMNIEKYLPAQQQKMSKEECFTTNNIMVSPSILEKAVLPKSHRKGFFGKCANVILHKLFLATNTFFHPLFRQQETINEAFLNHFYQQKTLVEQQQQYIIHLQSMLLTLQKKQQVFEKKSAQESVIRQQHEKNLSSLTTSFQDIEQRLQNFIAWKEAFEKEIHTFRTEHKNIKTEFLTKIIDLHTWIESMAKDMKGLYTWLENTRSEFFAEIKFQKKIQKEKDIATIQPRVLHPEKIQGKQSLKLNLGCGVFTKPDYINIDVRELEGVDIIATVDNLPSEKEQIAEIYAAHLIEHFDAFTLQNKLLPYWKSLLCKQGVLRIIVPDQDAMIEAYKTGEISWDVFREVTFGGQDYEGNYHFNMFHFPSLQKLLEHLGFIHITLVASARRNGQCYEMEVVSIKS